MYVAMELGLLVSDEELVSVEEKNYEKVIDC